jgi:DNA polymerase-3 subunit delta
MPETSNVIILHGTDEFAIAGHLDELRAAMGDPSTAEMNIAQFDGRAGLDFESLNTAVNAIPFMATRRLVILAHPSAAFPGRAPKQAAAEAEAAAEAAPSANRKRFLEMLEHLPPTSTLALVEYEFIKDDHWLLKWARASGGKAKILVCMMPKHWEMAGWIQQETSKQGGRIEREAAQSLSEMVGEDTRIAAQEITKLLTYVNYARPVTAADVEQASIVSAPGNIFILVDALGARDGAKAQKMLHQLLESEDPFSLWGMVIRQFRLLLQAREMLDERAGAPQVQAALGLRDFAAQKICDQARRFSIPALEAIYHRLLAIDEGTKTGQFPLELALDTLVVELAGSGGINPAVFPARGAG